MISSMSILRPLFKDPRVHYAVNCASIGCPNLSRDAFTGPTLDAQLDAAARTFINSPRAFRFDGDRLISSSIFSWFRADFGGNDEGVLRHANDIRPSCLGCPVVATGRDRQRRLRLAVERCGAMIADRRGRRAMRSPLAAALLAIVLTQRAQPQRSLSACSTALLSRYFLKRARKAVTAAQYSAAPDRLVSSRRDDDPCTPPVFGTNCTLSAAAVAAKIDRAAAISPPSWA